MTETTEQPDLQQLVEIDAQPPAITDNFEAVKAALAEHLERYRAIVDADQVPEAKAAATEINKLKSTLDQRIKAAIGEIRAPIDELDRKRKELVQLCEDSRQELLQQVNAFEAERRQAIEAQIEARRDTLWDEYGVDVDYRRAVYGDLVKLTAVTGKGALTQSTEQALQSRVLADLQAQQTVERRLLELENRCYRRGLGAPLTRDHVRHVLEADDAAYDAEIERLIAVELDREEQAYQRRQAQEQRRAASEEASFKDLTDSGGLAEAQETKRDDVSYELTSTQAEIEAHDAATQQPAEPDPSTDPDAVFGEPETEPAPDGDTRRCTVLAYFTLDVGAEASDDDITAECRRVMERAGISTLARVEVRWEDNHG